MKLKLAVCFATSVTVLCFAPSVTETVRASTIVFDNFGLGDTYDISSGRTISGSGSVVGKITQGFQFFPTSTGNLKLIETAIGLVLGSNEVSFELRKDTGANFPDLTSNGLLESFNFVEQMGDFGDFNPLLVGLSVQKPRLLNSTPYWLMANAPQDSTLSAWNDNSIEDTGLNYVNGFIFPENITRPAFRVSLAVVPEPSSILGLLTLGSLGAASTLKCKIKHSKSTEKEIDKV